MFLSVTVFDQSCLNSLLVTLQSSVNNSCISKVHRTTVLACSFVFTHLQSATQTPSATIIQVTGVSNICLTSWCYLPTALVSIPGVSCCQTCVPTNHINEANWQTVTLLLNVQRGRNSLLQLCGPTTSPNIRALLGLYSLLAPELCCTPCNCNITCTKAIGELMLSVIMVIIFPIALLGSLLRHI